MLELPRVKTRKGCEFRLFYKDQDMVIYTSRMVGSSSFSYEISRYQVHDSDKYHDEEYEYFPFGNDEAFGRTAWSCSNVESLKKVIKEHFPKSVLMEKLETFDFRVDV